VFRSWKVKEVKPPIREDMSIEEARGEIVVLMREENRNHHRMGLLHNHVVDKKLAQAANYKDAPDYFTKTLPDLSYASLRLYGAVAKVFSEELSVRFGISCLYLLLIYKEVAELKVDVEEPGDIAIEVPDEKGVVTTKRFGDCSVEQMRQAIRRKRKPTSSKPVPPEAVALADQYQVAVKDLFPKGTLAKVQVRNEKGEAVLDFKGIPVTHVSKLAAVLTADLAPMLEARRAEKAPPTA
jgi:hypothetical protein